MDSPSANPAVLAGASIQWIGLVGENLNRKPWFLPLNMEVSCKFSLKPTAISESTEYT
jgi:hypothetical protein